MTSATPLGIWLCMYELPASEFIGTVTEIRRLATVLQEVSLSEHMGKEVAPDIRVRMAGTIGSMRDHLVTMGADSAWVAAERFLNALNNHEEPLKYSELPEYIRDIESRFNDKLSFIRLFILRAEQLPLMGGAAELLGEPTASRFTSLWFDCEEAAKCICVWRPTAAVFHCMRMLEIGIKAFSARLGIPDPVKPAQRNWGAFLREIKNKIDATYSAERRMPGSEGAFMEALYATLDAVKNPWRNDTMHVEGVYTDAEARFILTNTAAFIQKMASGFDENGVDVNPALVLPGGGNGS